MKIFLTVFKVNSGHNFHKKKISKGRNSIKIADVVWGLFFAHQLIVVYICTKFHENILNGIGIRVVVVVVALLFYVHDKHLRSCRDGQLT